MLVTPNSASFFNNHFLSIRTEKLSTRNDSAMTLVLNSCNESNTRIKDCTFGYSWSLFGMLELNDIYSNC